MRESIKCELQCFHAACLHISALCCRAKALITQWLPHTSNIKFPALWASYAQGNMILLPTSNTLERVQKCRALTQAALYNPHTHMPAHTAHHSLIAKRCQRTQAGERRGVAFSTSRKLNEPALSAVSQRWMTGWSWDDSYEERAPLPEQQLACTDARQRLGLLGIYFAFWTSQRGSPSFYLAGNRSAAIYALHF